MAYTNTNLARLKDVKTMGVELKSEIDEIASKRTLTFTFPDMLIKTPLTLNFQNCEFSIIEDPAFDIAIVDAENKFICGKLR